MGAADRLQIVRECYRAYETGDRAMLERHLGDDFTFYSPADVGIDRARYFERCWPNAQQVAAFDYVRLVEIGDGARHLRVHARGRVEVSQHRGDELRR